MKEGRISDRDGFDGVTPGKVHMLRKKEHDYRKKSTPMRSAENWQDLIELTGGRISIHEIEAIQADAQFIHAGFKPLLIEALGELEFAHIFICTREKMHPDGLWLYNDLTDRIKRILAAAPDGKEPA